MLPKPAPGWLVPISTGYKGISPLYQPGEVMFSRDESVPFQFVESIYSIGEWLNPMRAESLENLFWFNSYDSENNLYQCKNSYVPKQSTL